LYSGSGPSFTSPLWVSQLSVGLEMTVNVEPARVYGLVSGAMTRLCLLPPAEPLPTRYSLLLCVSTLASMSQPPGLRLAPVKVFLKVYGPMGSDPALSSTWVRWLSQQAVLRGPAE
jgi:hypothetical protein